MACAIAQVVSRWLPIAVTRIQRSVQAGFVVNKVALGQVFSEYFGFPCQFSFHRLFHIHHHHLSSGAGTIGQRVADVPSGLSLTALQGEIKSVLETASFRVSTRNTRILNTFTRSSGRYPVARRVSASNKVRKSTNIFLNACFNENNLN
jgi:hypothetical protein